MQSPPHGPCALLFDRATPPLSVCSISSLPHVRWNPFRYWRPARDPSLGLTSGTPMMMLLELRRLADEKGFGKMLWSGSSTGVVEDASSGLQAAMQGPHTTSRGSGLRRYVGVVHVREQASKSMATSPILHPQSSHTFSATIRWHMLPGYSFTRHQAAGQRIEFSCSCGWALLYCLVPAVDDRYCLLLMMMIMMIQMLLLKWLRLLISLSVCLRRHRHGGALYTDALALHLGQPSHARLWAVTLFQTEA